MSDEAALNTDRELWRKGDGDGNGMSYYEPSIHVTEHGAIGINVGGTVYVKTVEEWHALAAANETLVEGRDLPFTPSRVTEKQIEGPGAPQVLYDYETEGLGGT